MNAARPANRAQAQAWLDEIARRRNRRSQHGKLFNKAPKPLSADDNAFFEQVIGPHEKQRIAVYDEAKKIALLCPRRTAKTTTMMLKALRTARIFPGSDIAYVVPSSKLHARRLFWQPLEQINEHYNLGMTFKVAEFRVITKEKTCIYVFGAKNKESPIILRGNAWSLAILDECKDFGTHFQELCIGALLPALEDYDAQLVLGGTPGEILEGTFYDITSPHEAPEGWSVHKWVKSDNPYLPEKKRNLEIVEREEYKPFGLTRESPKFRREQLAEWCTDDTERVYLYDRKRNGWEPDSSGDYVLPPGREWYYVLGLDLGERDANAFVVGAFSMDDLSLYITYEYQRARMSIDEIAEHTENLRRKFDPMVTMVADTGGYGRGIVTDLQTRKCLPFEAADKSGNKLGNIAQMNADFLNGRIKCRDNGLCAFEWKRLTRRIRATDKKIIITHSDIGDAALYMWRASKHYAAQLARPAPKPYTEEWWELEERQAVNRALERRRKAHEWWGQAVTDATA